MTQHRLASALALLGLFTTTKVDAHWGRFSAYPNLLPGYYQRWDQSANYAAFRALHPTMQNASLFNHATSRKVYEEQFERVLRRWAIAAADAGVGSASITSFIASRLNSHYATVRPNLAAAYSGLSEEQYKAIMIQCLVNGFYGYGSDNGYATNEGPYRTRSRELLELLALSSGDCATMCELVRLLGKAMGLDIRNVTVETDFTSSTGHYIYAVHAFNLLRDSRGRHTTIDAQTNIALDIGRLILSRMTNGHDLAVGGPGDGLFISEFAIDRFQTLRNHRRMYGLFNAYADDDVRFPAVARRADASVTNFFYNYFLEAYPRQGNSKWTVVNRYQAP